MSALRTRWSQDKYFLQMLNLVLETEQLESPAALREWFRTAPKVENYVGGEDFDLRCVDISGRSFGNISLAYCVLDGAQASDCDFQHTDFQRSTAQNCNFSNSKFNVAQMSPLYARGSNFNSCHFNSCFAQGVAPRHHTNADGVPTKGTFSDFRNCTFVNVTAVNTGFYRCDFRNADMANASFDSCDFSESDLRGAKFGNTTLTKCDMRGAMVEDTPEWRNALELNGNLNVDRIVWARDES